MNVDLLKLLGLGKCREITDIPTVAHGELEQCFGDGSFNQVQAIEKRAALSAAACSAEEDAVG